MKNNEPDVSMLKKVLHYDPSTGALRWKKRDPDTFNVKTEDPVVVSSRWNSANAGKIAFNRKCKRGYRRGTVFGRTLLAHRVAWAITYGKWPDMDVDHIDGDRGNNKISNLRDVSRSQNMRNQKIHSRNKSGTIGVSFNKATGKWRADICEFYIGEFDLKESAIEARKNEERRLGFHKNHGRNA